MIEPETQRDGDTGEARARVWAAIDAAEFDNYELAIDMMLDCLDEATLTKVAAYLAASR